jgi:hypothetical protein
MRPFALQVDGFCVRNVVQARISPASVITATPGQPDLLMQQHYLLCINAFV